MDVCAHPSLVNLNGFLQSHEQTITPPEASTVIFSYASTSIHSDIRTVPVESWGEKFLAGPHWNRKKHSKLYWRGSTAGADYVDSRPWNITQRTRFVKAANEKIGDLRTMPSTDNRFDPVSTGERVERALLSEEWMDVKFSGEPMQCDTITCPVLRANYPFEATDDVDTEKQWKFLMDIDENGPSTRFRELLATKSLVFKSTVFPEWYTDRIQPWLHYVPVKADYTDIYDLMAFFKGDIDGDGRDHDEMAAVLARAGHKWGLTFWRDEDMVAYIFRLILEYARVMDPDRDNLHFDG